MHPSVKMAALLQGGWGPEIVTNGGFSSDTAWTKGSGCVISGGVGSHSGASAGGFTQPSALVIANRIYRVEYTLVSLSGGAFQFNVGGTGGAVRASGTTGTFVEYIVASGANTNILPYFGANAVGSIDNISVKRRI